MKDRVPRQPGRMLVTPEDGGAAYYVTLARADDPEQEGTPLNRATLLSNETAVKLGLDADAATPSQALAGICTEFTAALPAAGWTGDAAPYEQTVDVAGLLAQDVPIADVLLTEGDDALMEAEEAAWGSVTLIKALDGQLYAKCRSSKPETDITVQLKVVR